MLKYSKDNKYDMLIRNLYMAFLEVYIASPYIALLPCISEPGWDGITRPVVRREDEFGV